MSKIIGMVLLLLVAYAVVKGSEMFKTRNDLDEAVIQQLDFVADDNQPAIRQKLADEAAKLGVELSPNNVYLAFVDTDERSVAQGYLAKIATFVNKRVTIHLTYTTRLLWVIPMRQEIEETKIRQIQAQEHQSSEMKQILEGPSR